MAQCVGVLYELNPLEFDCSSGSGCAVGDLIEAVRSNPAGVEEGVAQEIRDAHPERVPPDEVTDPHD